MHAAADGSSDYHPEVDTEGEPGAEAQPTLAKVIEREKNLARIGGPDLDCWRTYRLNRGTPVLGDREKIVSLDDWNACVYERRDLPKRPGLWPSGSTWAGP